MRVFIVILLIQLSLIGYERSPHIDQQLWNQLTPYFLPEDHPIKPKLDKIFSTRVTLDSTTLKVAGFKTPNPTRYTHTVVSKHPKLKGYLVKLYRDDYIDVVDWEEFLDRIIGAAYTRQAIERHGWNNWFKVPKKWLYPLPPEPAPPRGYRHGNFILVVEDMDIYEKKQNFAIYKSPKLSKEKLQALFTIIYEEGLDDSVVPNNVPFSKDQRIAFVDTQFYHKWPVRFYLTYLFLDPEMKPYWKLITHDGKLPNNPLNYPDFTINRAYHSE